MRSVLVVEDDAGVRDSLQHLLESWGHQVDVAADGLRGVELAQRPHDIVFVDLGLPLLDGCFVARRVRAVHGDDVLLVGVTGSRSPADRDRLLAAGVDVHLTKPVDPSTVHMLVDAVAEW
jgi:two-component system, sensor histidine kinase